MKTEKKVPTTYFLNYEDYDGWDAQSYATDESDDPALISLKFQHPVKDIRLEYRQEGGFTPFERKYHAYMMMLGVYEAITFYYREGDYSYWKEHYDSIEAFRQDSHEPPAVDLFFKWRMKKVMIRKMKERYYSRSLELTLEEFLDRLILDEEFILIEENAEQKEAVLQEISGHEIFEFHYTYEEMTQMRFNLLTEEEKEKMYREMDDRSVNELWDHLKKWREEKNGKNRSDTSQRAAAEKNCDGMYAGTINIGLQRGYTGEYFEKNDYVEFIKGWQDFRAEAGLPVLPAAVYEFDLVNGDLTERHLALKFIKKTDGSLSKEDFGNALLSLAEIMGRKFEQRHILVEFTDQNILVENYKVPKAD